MNLEDHLGDVIRKARMMKNVPPQTAAAAARLSEADLTEIESSGKATKPVNFAALGSVLYLDGNKLQQIASGWLPSSKELSTWRELRCFNTQANDISVNC